MAMDEKQLSPFETIRRDAEDGSEYWSARDLAKILGYTQWRNFVLAIRKAKESCQNSGQAVADHFADTSKMIKAGKGAQRRIDDVLLFEGGHLFFFIRERRQFLDAVANFLEVDNPSRTGA